MNTELNRKHVQTIKSFLKGKRLEKFLASVQILNDSLREGTWSVPRGAVKAKSGFYQGIASKVPRGYHHEIHMSLRFGWPLRRELPEAMWQEVPFPDAVAKAWAALCAEKEAAIKALDEARPVKDIGLSRS